MHPTNRGCLVVCAATLFVTASAACTVSPRLDPSKDNASAPVAAPVPVAPVVEAPVTAAPPLAAPASPPPRVIPAAAAAPPRARRSGETCGHSPDNCEVGFFCSSADGSTCQPISKHAPGTRIGDPCTTFRDCHGPMNCNLTSHRCQSFELAAGASCAVNLACASRNCVKPTPTGVGFPSTIGTCR